MFTFTILSGCFLAAVSCKIKKVKAPVVTQLIWYFHIAMLFFSVLCLVLLFSGYGFKGAYTERVFFTFYAGSAVVLYGLTPQEVSGKWVYLGAFYIFPFILAFGFLLPPLRNLTVITGLELLSDGHMERYAIDEDYALQAKTIDIIDRSPEFSLVEDKYWFFEKISGKVIDPGKNLVGLKMQKTGKDSVRLQLALMEDAGRPGRLDTVITLIR